jgi:hypothetical protein
MPSSVINPRSKSVAYRFEKRLGNRLDEVASPFFLWRVTPVDICVSRLAKVHDNLDDGTTGQILGAGVMWPAAEES